MKTYIVKDNNKLKIIQVTPGSEARFLARYQDQVLVSAGNIHDVLIRFGQPIVIIESPELFQVLVVLVDFLSHPKLLN